METHHPAADNAARVLLHTDLNATRSSFFGRNTAILRRLSLSKYFKKSCSSAVSSRVAEKKMATLSRLQYLDLTLRCCWEGREQLLKAFRFSERHPHYSRGIFVDASHIDECQLSAFNPQACLNFAGHAVA